jgi:SNF2 family DNA or RNA helicase
MSLKSTTAKTRRFTQSNAPKKWTPHGCQKKAVKFLLEHAAAALFLDPGLGKTSITLSTFNFLRKAKVAAKVLVIAPLRVCHQVWPSEAAEWQDFAHLRVVVLHGPKKEQRLQEDADIYVINPEGLEWLIFGDGKKDRRFDKRRWAKLGFDTLVIDELTKFKNPSGSRFKALKLVLDSFARRWGLTGTPAPNGLLDLFGQCFVLDGGNALGRFITHYRLTYFRPLDPNGWKWALQPGAAERIYERLKPLALRMAAEDYLELPERVDLKHYVVLPPPAMKLYEDMEEELLALYGDNLITAGNGGAASMKCRQICNGALYVDDDIAAKFKGKKRAVLSVHDAKLDALEELVNELQGQQLLVAYEFNHDLDRLRARFPDAAYIGKGISPAEGKNIEDRWNRGEIDLLFGQPASMGHGGNFQKSHAAHICWFGQFWDYELYDQFIKRILRQGNKAKRVFNHHIIAKDTVDEVVYYDKIRKARGQGQLFEALTEIRKARGSEAA